VNEIEFLAKTLKQHMDQGSPVVLISVMSLEGSTPRHDGTKMVVGAGGKPYGTIGGSLIEAAAIKEAEKVLSSGESKIMTFELDGKDASAPGMICGGKAEIILDFLAPVEENRKFADNLNQAITQGKDFFILTNFSKNPRKVEVGGHAIMDTNYNILPGSSLSSTIVEKLKPELHNVSTTLVMPCGNTMVLVDRIRKVKTVYCFGGGHVAVPTVHLAALVGFRVVVLDDRREFANPERFPEAAGTIVLGDYSKATNGLEIDKDSFIVIITRGHKYDREVLERALLTQAGYIGMISSRRKREAIYEALRASGVKQKTLDFIHSPIGIDIGGETPEEIAVSIVAELVKVRKGLKG
jgi:xanthine dehydrogenase accessory factor